MFGTSGQSSAEHLIDRCHLICRPIRDLLVDYLRERQPTVDYVTLQCLAGTLGKLFWADLEHHPPGIDSLRLAPEVAAAWKQRILTRESGLSTLAMVRAFYLDIAQWAMEEPTRWGPWAAPSPIRAEEIRRTKSLQRRKSRMNQRTRERLPVLPTLVASANTERRAAAEKLAAAEATAPGETFDIISLAEEAGLKRNRLTHKHTDLADPPPWRRGRGRFRRGDRGAARGPGRALSVLAANVLLRPFGSVGVRLRRAGSVPGGARARVHAAGRGPTRQDPL
ncbi:hypothetical protein OIE68_00585 [Nocardia vinacea]|uniref:hypothetical protein n=1 Tax=Nocardia vinacea TaxID=96468 RepID=UPI002E0E55B1|nr:hypothetical protein OIE68_00585 [Nocardia vinacea]